MTIKTFSIEYDAINSNNTFTNGDTINGRIILETSKETKIQSLLFTGKGKAQVRWHDYYGQKQHVFWANDKYYSVKHHILREARQDGTEVIGKGRHVFPFSFKIPDRNMPSTFTSVTGKIIHKVKAELKQSMKLTKKAETHFTFVSKADMNIPGLMEPQNGCKDKSVTFFGSGNISMDIHTKQMGYKQGETLQVTAKISNRSTRTVKPKFVLYEKQSFFAQGSRKLFTKEIIKEKIEPLESSGTQTVTKTITIPKGLPASILNCPIIRLEYRLRVYLDVKCAQNPEVKFPIVILPASGIPATAQPYDYAAFSPNPPAWGPAPPQPAAYPLVGPPPPYGAYGPNPSQDPDLSYGVDRKY
ncbi:arrestin domain-containing protein 3-like [Genypterus blacodes]|uniref:arrestin domain-containing protein 3-like n=1 Tax=Genypterus blacodes TaxID=154954 RepID=UPI003F760BF5